MRQRTAPKAAVLPRFATVLGRGVEPVFEHGEIVDHVISAASAARADRIIAYHRKHPGVLEEVGCIAVSGGYPGVSAGMAPPPADRREATLIADRMIQHGVEGWLIEVERDSVSTTDNMARMLRMGIFEDVKFDDSNPMLLVASRGHALRSVPLVRASYDIDDAHGIRVLRAENDGAAQYAREYGGTHLILSALDQAAPAARSAEGMDAVGEQFHRIMGDRSEIVSALAHYALQVPLLARQMDYLDLDLAA